jgi:hypothetical protein
MTVADTDHSASRLIEKFRGEGVTDSDKVPAAILVTIVYFITNIPSMDLMKHSQWIRPKTAKAGYLKLCHVAIENGMQQPY